jgi:long-chain acyl-CoA synthetase
MVYENLAHCAKDVAERYSGNTLFKYNGQTLTFADAYARVTERAAALQKEGFAPGDVIALLSGNSPEWCETFLAITSIGCIALPLDTGLPHDRYDEMMRFAEAKAIFLSEAFADVPTGVRKLPVAFATEPKRVELQPPPMTRATAAVLLFTSGTTGNPKVVQLTHGNILHIAVVCTELENYTPQDVTLAILPLFHVYALESTFMAPLVTGSTIVLQPSLKGPDILKSLAENPVTIFPAAPQMWRLFFDAIAGKVKAQSMAKYRLFMFAVNHAPTLRKLGFSPLLNKMFGPIHDLLGRKHRFFISGGASLKKEYFDAYKHMGFDIMEGYGLTETTGPIAIPYYKDSVAGSVGAPIKGNEVKLKNVGPDGIGEVWLRGEAVMSGYYKNEEANQKAFDADRYFNSGDLGRLDDKGAIFLTGRFKNVLVLDSGKNVYPEELEQYYSSSPEIEEISVIGRNIDGEETVCAVIVPVHKDAGSYERVRASLRALEKGLPSYKVIRRFALSFEPLPKNSTRKVLVSDVKRLWDEGKLIAGENDPVPRREILATNAREELALELLKKVLKRDAIYFDDAFSEFGIDSLGLIELVVQCEEQMQMSLDVSSIHTVQDLFEALSKGDQSKGPSIEERIFSSPITTKGFPFFNPFHHLSLGLLSGLSKLFWKISAVNAAALDTDNCIIAANHQSYLDIIWIASFLPMGRRKQLYVIGKKRLSFLRFLIPMLPCVFVEESSTLPSLKASADLLRAGNTLVIFPEGTRTSDGAVLPFKTGAAYLARNLGKKIVPVSLTGAFEAYPNTRVLPRLFTEKPGKVVVGEPIDPAKFASVDALNSELRRVIIKNMQGD